MWEGATPRAGAPGQAGDTIGPAGQDLLRDLAGAGWDPVSRVSESEMGGIWMIANAAGERLHMAVTVVKGRHAAQEAPARG